MASNSEDVYLRCKGCGRDLKSTATIRTPQGTAGDRLMSRAKWVLGLMRCDSCQAEKDAK